MKVQRFMGIFLALLLLLPSPAWATQVDISEVPNLTLDVANENLNAFTSNLLPGDERQTSLEFSNLSNGIAMLKLQATCALAEKTSLLDKSELSLVWQNELLYEGSLVAFCQSGGIDLGAIEPGAEATATATLAVAADAKNDCTLDNNMLSWKVSATKEKEEAPVLPKTGIDVASAVAIGAVCVACAQAKRSKR